MKQVILIVSLLVVNIGFSQNNKPYSEWLKGINEITVTDSIHFSVPDQQTEAENPGLINNFFYPLYSPANEQMNRKTTYHVTGKITGNPDYDIILLYKFIWHSDSLILKDLFMNTMSKTGKLLHFQLIAHQSVYNNDQTVSSCWFYKPDMLKVTTSRTITGKNLMHTMEFIINQHGTIVAQTRSIAGN